MRSVATNRGKNRAEKFLQEEGVLGEGDAKKMWKRVLVLRIGESERQDCSTLSSS